MARGLPDTVCRKCDRVALRFMVDVCACVRVYVCVYFTKKSYPFMVHTIGGTESYQSPFVGRSEQTGSRISPDGRGNCIDRPRTDGGFC